MKEATLSRRTFLRRTAAGVGATGAVVLLNACSGPECGGADNLSRGELSVRKSVNYTEKSDSADTSCSNCAMFGSVEGQHCGNCEFLTGPVNSLGLCDNWSET